MTQWQAYHLVVHRPAIPSLGSGDQDLWDRWDPWGQWDLWVWDQGVPVDLAGVRILGAQEDRLVHGDLILPLSLQE